MAEKQGFIQRIRGNAEWEALKLLGGSGVLTAIINGIRSAIRRDPGDWVLWLLVFCVGAIFITVGYVRGKKPHIVSKIGDSPAGTELAVNSSIQRGDADEVRRMEMQYEAELERARECYRQCKEEKKQLVAEKQEYANRCLDYRAEIAKYTDLFSPLQFDCLRLSKDILDFLEKMGKRPVPDREKFGYNPDTKGWTQADHIEAFLVRHNVDTHVWEMKITSVWQSDFAKRVADIVPRIGQEGIDANWMRRHEYGQFVSNNVFFDIARQLVYIAHSLDTRRVVPSLDEVPK